jgi:tetratricopeptide (TPR) repeat protein
VVLAVAAGGFFFLLVHGVFTNPSQFVSHFDRITGPYSANVRFFEKSLSGHWQMAKLSWRHMMFSFGWPLWAACLGGVVAALRRGSGTNRPLFAVLLLVAASYYLTFLSVILYQYDRFHLPFAVLLAPFGGFLIGQVAAAAAIPRWLRMAGLSVVFAYSAVRAFEIDWLMRNDTRYAMERLVASRGLGASGVLGIGQPQMLPRVATLHPSAVLRNAGAVLDRANARYLVINSTAQWDRSGQTVRAGLLDRRYPFRRIAVVPRGQAPLRLLDREGITSSLYFVSPELELYERLTGAWSDWAIARSKGRVADLLRYAAEERERGRYSEARRLDEAAAAREPQDAAPVLGLGLDAEGLGRREEAEACFRQAESLDPGWKEPPMALARLLVVQGRPDAGWQEALRAMDLGRESTEARLLVASIAARSGRRQMAWNLARDVEGGLRERTDGPGLARLAEVYRSLGAEVRAREAERAAAASGAASEASSVSRDRPAMTASGAEETER